MESLYRKYRPQTFDDVVGQQHVVETLEHAVLEGRTSHAYLFCGPRGTGKTTMARILAKALLCEQGPGHLPDGTCEQCRLIAEGEHPDVYELDAASRTGVDNVREEIINRVSYAPARGRYKVYIIDEVHMLTTAAFNALLKTLEEPPSHVVFVLCTTDPQKIPATILSRVQRFDFHPIGSEDMRARLEYVCEQEGFTYDEAALDLVVRHARGGMRDALSTLEQLSVFGDGQVTLASAQDLLGEVPGSSLHAVTQALATRDVAALFGEVGKLVDAGRDLLQFVRELAAHVRDVYVVCAVGARPGVVQASGEELETLKAEADAFGSPDRLARVLSILGEASGEMRTATNQRLVLEIALTRMARPESDLTLEALAERVDELEREVAALSEPGAVARVHAEQRPVAPRSQGQAAPAAAHGAQASQQRRAPARQTSPQPEPAPVAGGAPSGAGRSVPQRRAQERPAPVAARPPRQAPAGRTAPAGRAAAPASMAQPVAGGSNAPITDAGELQRKWKQVVDTLVRTAASRGSLLMNSTIESDDGNLLKVSLPKGSSFALHMLERQDVRSIVDPVVRQVFGPRQVSFGEASAPESGAVRAARRARGAARGQAPAHGGGRTRAEQNSAPTPSQPAPPQVLPPPRQQQAPVPQPQAPAPQPFEEPVYDEVPYDDLSAVSYDEAVPGESGPAPQPSPAPSQAAVAPRARQPQRQAAGHGPSQAERPAPEPAPVKTRDDSRAGAQSPAQTAPGSAATESKASAVGPSDPKGDADGKARKVPDDIPPDLISIVESAFDVFGDGVKISKA